MTELEKMARGEFGDTSDPAIRELYEATMRNLKELNKFTMHMDGYRKALAAVVPGVPESSAVMTPFHCDYGVNIHIGEHVFINSGSTFLDSGSIEIGEHTLIGPSVQVYTPEHPMDYVERRKTIERAFPVKIGADCWIGGGAVICPGVTIGDRSIIGAGSVVTKDIPSDSMAVGNPARVIKKLGSHVD